MLFRSPPGRPGALVCSHNSFPYVLLIGLFCVVSWVGKDLEEVNNFEWLIDNCLLIESFRSGNKNEDEYVFWP